MSETRTSFFDFDATKMFADFPFKPFDVEAMWATSRRNVEAWSQANRVAVEGAQALAKRQVEMVRQGFEDLTTFVRDLSQPVSAEERITKNTEFAKQAIDKSLKHTREIATMAAKTGSEASEVLHKRAAEGFDEFRAMTCTKVAKAKSTPV
ncbi:MAG TPA: phasin family protein [Stellaceae bacterium]|jgi:phasin family protein